ncbi:MAG: ATP-binding protein [Candidatus Aminicenantes bacterium]|jgi:AAA+ ATPase superfamily predicted ATPase|nr:ATP-binding protein [Candidatus Aminicenantes bacterium]
MKFIDRERELNNLKAWWASKDAQLIVIYGRRRIGKTELIKHFIKDKPHIYFLAQQISEAENLKTLGKIVGEYFDDMILKEKGFDNWSTFFEYLKKHVKERLIIAIDEFPYLAESNKGISSVFQAGWDEHLKELPIFLILCGSSMAMMEREVLSFKAPLYGRRTGQLRLKPFSFFEASEFFSGLSFEDRLLYYSVLGGNPSYLSRVNPKKSWEENIVSLILSPASPLYSEVEFLLHEELREPRNYFSILKAIALNKTRISEIVNETGFDKSILHKYLFVLEDLQLIQKEYPVTEKNPLKSKKGLYRLQDQYFKFWFRYVLPNKSRLEEGREDLVLEIIRNDITSLVAENYEQVAREILSRDQTKIFSFDRLGRWWDRNEEIDLVALNEKEKKILLGEVKWSNKPVGLNILEELKRKSSLIDWERSKRKEYYCLFSKSGFTETIIKQAREERILLFHKDRIV